MDYEKLKESQTVEIKTASDHLPGSVFETYSAFANTQGGVIYLGIKEQSPKNAILGVTNAPMLKKSFFDAIHNAAKVSVALGGEEMWVKREIDGKTIIEIHVPEAPLSVKPVFLNGNPAFSYIRGHEGDYVATLLERRAMELDAFPQKFDMRPNALGYRFEDLNQQTLASYRALFNVQNKNNLLMGEDDEAFFRAIGALKRDEKGTYVPTNAAILMFGNYLMIKEVFPEFNLDYRVNHTGQSRWDYRLDASSLTWSGNAFDFFQMVVSNLRPMLPNPFHLSGVYEDGGEDLLECVREGLTNAIANCDYLLPGGIVVTYNGSAISFKNAGKLRLALPQVLEGGNSDPRNEGVMNLLHLVKIGDKAGEGIPNLFRRAKRLGLPNPILEQSNAPFRTTLTLLLTNAALSSDASLDGKIIALLKERGGCSALSLSQALNVNVPTVTLALKRLLSSGLIVDNGKKTKGRKYELKNLL